MNERGSGVAAPGDAAPAPVGRRAPRARTRTTALSLRVKLVLLSAGLTVGIVGVLFTLLGVTVRTQTRRLLTATLAGHQHRLAEAQAEETRALLRLSSLMTESPTLRAALETYQSEWDSAGLLREDLLATIRHEVERLAAGLDRDLVMVTGTGGAVLAARETRDPRPEARPTWRVVPTDSWPCDTSVDPAAPAPAGQSGILVLGGQHYLAACVPIVLGGDVIGSLLVGDRLDATFARRVHGLSGAEVVITTGRSVLASSRDDLATVWPAGAHDAGVGAWRDAGGTGASGTDPAAAAGAEGGRLIRLGSEEYVSVAVPLSPARGGPEATLHLMHSLTGAVGTADRDLRRALFVCGGLALILAVAAASTVARSILRPLDRFVAFLREVTASGDRARRAPDPGTSPEMTTLARTYDEMMSSLEEHEQNLLKHAREDLERIERLQESEKLAALGRMLSGAAHEINNPLAGVLGNIDLLLGDPAIPEAVRRRLETTSREGRRIVGLVRNLLKTVHRDDGRRAPVDVNQVVRECCDLRRHDFRAAGVALEQQLSDEASTVLGSEIELQQVALNVINNALDALQEGAGPGRRLTVRTGAGEGEVVVEFLDNGPGMQDPARVFDHFYTTKPVGKGTGLGLSIANAVVRGHGGTLTATNRPGGGACFIIRLPRAGRRAAAAPGGISGLAAAPPAPTGGGTAPAPGACPVGEGPQAPRPLPARVLVVDDEPSVLELQITILEMHGATVAGARSGREAVEALGREPFDLVVSDLRMPGEITGRDLYHWAESHRPETARRFVFVTGDTLSDDAADFIRATGRRCVQKPFSVEGYLDVLSEAFRDLPAAA